MTEVAIKTDIKEDINDVKEFVSFINELKKEKNELCFLTIDEIFNKKILPWSKVTIQALFNRPDFPSCDLGKEKVVTVRAFIRYFDVPRRKK